MGKRFDPFQHDSLGSDRQFMHTAQDSIYAVANEHKAFKRLYMNVTRPILNGMFYEQVNCLRDLFISEHVSITKKPPQERIFNTHLLELYAKA
jgi:hypothetical protein